MRQYKFRGKRVDNGEWVFGSLVKGYDATYIVYKGFDDDYKYNFEGLFIPVLPETVGQFTGMMDKNGKEIFEGDIFRIEEDTDTVDRVIYVVITWVQEWCMFATLRVEDEYPAYLNEGMEALDEPMFWTYTLEDTNSRKHFLCGNIHDNPELIKRTA